MRTCWICLETEEESSTEFIRPCKCTGTIEYVHKHCFIKYLRNNFYCKFCRFKYKIEMIQSPYLIFYERLLKITEYFLIGLGIIIIGLCIYIILATYGLTVMYFIRGIEYSKNVNIKLLIGLPFIPITILYSGFIGYDENLHALISMLFLDLERIDHFLIALVPLLFLFHLYKFKGFQSDIDNEIYNNLILEATNIYNNTLNIVSEIVINNQVIPVSMITHLLIVPYISSILGFIFPVDNLQRAAIGCILYFFIKEVGYLIYLHKLEQRIKSIKIIEPLEE